MIRAILSIVLRHPLSMAGGAVATAAGASIAAIFAMDLWRGIESPYFGVLAYLILPAVLVGGLILIPLGAWRARRAGEGRRLPVVDFNDEGTRLRLIAVTALTAANLVLMAVATYEGTHVLESTSFCGNACHQVMEPQAVNHALSPHAAIGCVDCHVGPGAGSFFEAKLAGAWQVVSTTFDLYPRPIVLEHGELPAASETCEGCHTAADPKGSVLRKISSTDTDEANTELWTVMMLHVGGRRAGRSEGIHWHADPANVVRYRPDATGEYAVEVEVVRAGGERRVYRRPGAAEADPPHGWQRMDCLECHNRVGHPIPSLERALDRAFAEGRLPRSLPGLKARAMTVLEEPGVDGESLADRLRTAFGDYPPGEVEPVVETLRAIHAAGNFPAMAVDRTTYVDRSGHEDGPGCLRCHDDEMQTDDEITLAGDCELCHAVLAWEEAEPEVLRALQP